MFRSWAEGLEVWDFVTRRVPEPEAICVMPDHLHIVVGSDVRAALGRSLSGLARKRNARDGASGPLFRPLPKAHRIVGPKKLQRSIRYVHLNPCRAGLVDDPLAWALSTHRDAVGLTWRRVGPRRRSTFHEYVSADPSVAVSGTCLPGGALGSRDPTDVIVAVSNVLRLPMDQVGRSVLGRSLVRAACDELCPVTRRKLATLLGVGERTMRRRRAVDSHLVDRVQQVLRDERFGPIDRANLVGLPAWQRYARRRR